MPYVLIVEDDKSVRDMVRLFLESNKYEAATAANGQDALALMLERRPCLVLLDMHLPVMDGWEFRKRQLENPALADVPVVCITAMFHPDDVGRSLGIPCLGKPMEFPAILRAVQAACGPPSS